MHVHTQLNTYFVIWRDGENGANSIFFGKSKIKFFFQLFTTPHAHTYTIEYLYRYMERYKKWREFKFFFLKSKIKKIFQLFTTPHVHTYSFEYLIRYL